MNPSNVPVLYDIMGNPVERQSDIWQSVRELVLKSCESKDDSFTELALALAFYDYYNAPSNWDPKYQHEYPHQNTIIQWTEWCIENSDTYERITTYVREDYRKGKIPNAFDLLIDYFC